MKNFVLTMVVLFCLIAGGAFILLNTPIVINMMLPEFVNERVKTFTIEHFKCEGQKSQLPDMFFLYRLSMRVKSGNRVFDIKADELSIYNFFDFIKKAELLRLSGSGIDVQTERLAASDAKLKATVGLKDGRMTFAEGIAYAKNLNPGAYSLTKTMGHFRMNPKKIEMFDVEGNAYGGSFSGQLTLDYKPHFSYVLWSEFQSIKSPSAGLIHSDFFKTINGSFDGSIRVVGGKIVDIFTVIFQAHPGLSIGPDVFLGMDGVFDEEEKNELRRLSEEGAALTVERAALHMQNSRDQKVMMVFDIEEATSNFVLKGRFPLVWKRGFEDLLFPAIDQEQQLVQ